MNVIKVYPFLSADALVNTGGADISGLFFASGIEDDGRSDGGLIGLLSGDSMGFPASDDFILMPRLTGIFSWCWLF